MRALEEEAECVRYRRMLLERAKDEIQDGSHREASRLIIAALESVTNSEERVIRLHAECVAILEQGQKILALDAMSRPVQIFIPEKQNDE